MKKTVMLLLLILAACGGEEALKGQEPRQHLVIAHRGASGYLPEHTMAGYELAIRMGADYIEPDLQLTKDGELVLMHDGTMERTTDIAKLFSPRNGKYRVADFTLAEIKTLTVHPTNNAKHNYPRFYPSMLDPFRVPTMLELLEFVKKQSDVEKRRIGIYPEIGVGDAMEDALLRALLNHDYGSESKIFIQSFSDITLRSLRKKENVSSEKFPQILLGLAVMGQDGVAQVKLMNATGSILSLKDVTKFADGVGLMINNVTYPVTKDFIVQAHANGLIVHGWTFSKSDYSVAIDEYSKYLSMGMDGMFTDYPDLASMAR